MATPLLVAVDVGTRFHEVAVGDNSGCALDGFRIDHDLGGFRAFFKRVEGNPTTSLGSAASRRGEWRGNLCGSQLAIVTATESS